MEENQYPFFTCKLHEGQLDKLLTDVRKIKEDIHGNGNDGIKIRLSILEKDVKEMPELKKRLDGISKTVWIGYGIAIVVQPILVAIFLHLIGDKP